MANSRSDLRHGIFIFLLGLFILTLSLHFVFDATCTDPGSVNQCTANSNGSIPDKGEEVNSIFHIGFLLPTQLAIALPWFIPGIDQVEVIQSKDLAILPQTPPPNSL